MKLHILSDLHTEMAPFGLPETNADVVVLAGDIGYGRKGVAGAVQACQRQGKPVLFVPGNHDFYHQTEGIGIQGVIEQMKCEALGSDVHVLDDDEVIIGGVRFLGSTLWTDFDFFGEGLRDLVMMAAKKGINDYRCITDGSSPLTPAVLRERHLRSREWLRQSLANGCGLKTVIITHHAPHGRSCPSHFRHDPVSAAFISDMAPFMGEAALWVHGHVHASMDYRLGDTRVLCNPRGYSGEDVPGFRADLVVEV
ncbi:metallophosphoesterase [Magnetococcus marinus MC-1]|uniref:Metallophosphoesterase n=1 Tax=Magnetococcus marinus (strain ATCC BAA-1437 / JCM 17883 / MC-1) TaxID=156889 RepID=A0L955_MAGMM|nr:metallophosphoesterase [Magnetococcus marinus]ABK44498.1 metallophosphoesterase [Magnetococcus marinus MC-1]